MNILDTIMNAGNGAAVRQIGSQVGLDESQTATALSALVPALVCRCAAESAVGRWPERTPRRAIGRNHQRYVENPAVLGEAEYCRGRQRHLGHIFGSKDVSRRVAAETGAQTGLAPDVMKRMLPLVATLVMGAMSRQAATGGTSSLTTGAGSGGLLEMLGGALDSNKDGSALDDITGMIGRTFGRS